MYPAADNIQLINIVSMAIKYVQEGSTPHTNTV